MLVVSGDEHDRNAEALRETSAPASCFGADMAGAGTAPCRASRLVFRRQATGGGRRRGSDRRGSASVVGGRRRPFRQRYDGAAAPASQMIFVLLFRTRRNSFVGRPFSGHPPPCIRSRPLAWTRCEEAPSRLGVVRGAISRSLAQTSSPLPTHCRRRDPCLLVDCPRR